MTDTFLGQIVSSSLGKASKHIHFAARMHLHHEKKKPCRYISWPDCIFITGKDIKADTFCCQDASSS